MQAPMSKCNKANALAPCRLDDSPFMLQNILNWLHAPSINGSWHICLPLGRTIRVSWLLKLN